MKSILQQDLFQKMGDGNLIVVNRIRYVFYTPEYHIHTVSVTQNVGRFM